MSPIELNPESIIDFFAGDRELAKEALAQALEGAEENYAELQKAVSQLDLDGCERRAHSLKGNLAYFQMDWTSSLCFEIEEAARQQDQSALNEHNQRLNSQFDSLLNELKKFVDEL